MKKAVPVLFALALAPAWTFAQTAPASEKPKPPERPPIKALYEGKSAEAAAQALVDQALKISQNDPWVTLTAARVLYLGGNKAAGQALVDKLSGASLDGESLLVIAGMYAQAGEFDRAEPYLRRALVDEDPDTVVQVAALYLAHGDRAKGEEALAKIFSRPDSDPETLLKAAAGFLKVGN
ncbi:MAG: tetratricopeptide repeat protein [Acidobacteriota bacterium]